MKVRRDIIYEFNIFYYKIYQKIPISAFAATTTAAAYFSLVRDEKPLGATKTALKVIDNFITLIFHSLIVCLTISFLERVEF